MIATCQEREYDPGFLASRAPAEDLAAARDRLVARLEEGARQIERARAEGEDVAPLEDFWIDLVRRYERVCDQLELANERV
jgi:hypothetical protein